MSDEVQELRCAIDSIAVHTFHMLYLLDSEKWAEFKHYFDSYPRGMSQHIGEISKICAEAGSGVAQTGNVNAPWRGRDDKSLEKPSDAEHLYGCDAWSCAQKPNNER